ncbi:putative Homoserine O-acetyltransferase [Taphrina deformans PYCC 5710]|uniref:Homoserine O-acetyltransferase n=1 Tax=Taphrina deformans (strain PYCC 5710 / ATCC 11124 / CBS 356.35 / IMI 108563 / JCM 9778 / NBRC 8474) TaxID=1097556 RepID=R4XC84_TAPDE|nr:putative Homoserine O-acetyltransferase [Taphrina deformans PYCC 5710]|eukprot:CCG81986.1 putative Homoserine O-acetyltransferase [Taphrina deformans PYCC 5710]
MTAVLQHFDGQDENPFASLVSNQKLARFDRVVLESGAVLDNVPVGYKTWGHLNDARDNCLIICHAFTGSADAEDWWGPLFGPGKAFDYSKYFIFCGNSLGSPYGSASACTNNPETGAIYGPEFPLVTVRDDVQVHKRIIDALDVKQIACVVGGSMGGMLVLEWAFFGSTFVKTLIPVATSARASAWNISWGETQRQSIYCDPKYEDGYYTYDDPPVAGLGAARMSALLTYRSRNSFEMRFGRNVAKPCTQPYPDKPESKTPSDEHWIAHNEGHSKRLSSRPARSSSSASSPVSRSSSFDGIMENSVSSLSNSASSIVPPRKAATQFSAQSYLRYQAQKFVKRFDANCYISITRKLDTHDISRGRASSLHEALAMIDQHALVLGIESDGLFTFSEQEEIASHMPNAKLDRIISPEGHDGFLLEFGQMNDKIIGFQKKYLPEIMHARADQRIIVNGVISSTEADHAVKPSTFGEVDDSPGAITEW